MILLVILNFHFFKCENALNHVCLAYGAEMYKYGTESSIEKEILALKKECF